MNDDSEIGTEVWPMQVQSPWFNSSTRYDDLNIFIYTNVDMKTVKKNKDLNTSRLKIFAHLIYKKVRCQAQAFLYGSSQVSFSSLLYFIWVAFCFFYWHLLRK